MKMILKEIRLSNFRCFFGKTSIQFSEDPDRNVTIIYAENGVGKTTLLNALRWCLHGDTTANFEERSEILNFDAKKAGETTASVDVIFEHNESRYIAKRYSCIRSTSRREFEVARIEDGSQIPVRTPETFINTVMPREMASHFLFDGEYAELFLGEDNRERIKCAVRDILGCSLIETAIDDLDDVSDKFRKQIPTSASENKFERLNTQYDDIKSRIENANNEIQRLTSEISTTKDQINNIEEKLRNTAAASELQNSRDQLLSQLHRAEKPQKACKDEVYKWLGENGRFIVSKRITEDTFSFLDEKEHRGQIPSPYNEEFVKDILEAEVCICGTELKPGSLESIRVASLLRKAANKVMRDRVTMVRARIANLKTERIKSPDRLMKSKIRLAEINCEIESIEAQLGEIRDKLKGINFDDISDREKRREKLMNMIEEYNTLIGSEKAIIDNLEKQKSDINWDINKLTQKHKYAAVFGRRRKLCDDIRRILEENLAKEEEQARDVLRAGIRSILEKTTHKVLKLRMTDDYIISLVNADGVSLPKSSGENQLLGLAFTATLIKFAKDRMNAQGYQLLPGTIAPLVLDSPFGQLDVSYRKTTAEFIPKMAQQVILLVSKSQGSQDVLKILNKHLGAEYLLVRHNSESRGHRKQERRHLHGKDYECVTFDAEFDGTEIVEIRSP